MLMSATLNQLVPAEESATIPLVDTLVIVLMGTKNQIVQKVFYY